MYSLLLQRQKVFFVSCNTFLLISTTLLWNSAQVYPPPPPYTHIQKFLNLPLSTPPTDLRAHPVWPFKPSQESELPAALQIVPSSASRCTHADRGGAEKLEHFGHLKGFICVVKLHALHAVQCAQCGRQWAMWMTPRGAEGMSSCCRAISSAWGLTLQCVET